ncbi:MAG: 16S rRNA (guanine(966)-N(2))-methyltransferase RsmD [Proteobacteria bacterium]|nr:16S rRNA (guanine(966)-N(2))-methyltransferase RsmD [Pseudomonadota bacterium]MBU4276814.1 16S rRNA (guanine(966)-N(2))-methyltransferase RsmD [Pseudomonadota bacterium]MBU4384169.1 16S rRNA (guanine(966)-N(2))-methyltransferase RsmD [Pseudomonadota bacterium]MBU4605062.1 16S rRNA (guanine(966)-N(2))-methyltransferase RsmD [Pseudomonadota bacterium]MCG2763090.1 16S rRNA (guanine(966)-N(2))-methyltransferase RsmD [Desulfarculaceae bacterium]
MLKITGGRLRGRNLKVTPGLAIRPTGAKMRQALFNILGPRVADARVADLYAGSGALGLEALSRGAASCLFVEKSRPTAQLIQANLASLGLEDQSRVVATGLEAATGALKAAAPFDLVLADPPYGKGQVARLLELAAQGWLLAPEGLLIIEHSPKEAPEAPGGLEIYDHRRYGQSELSFLAPSSDSRGDGT